MPSTTSKSVEEIIAVADGLRSDLDDQEQAIEDEISTINTLRIDRKLTDAEIKRRKTLREVQAAVRSAQLELSIETLQALDQSNEVTRLSNAFDDINRELGKELGRINDVAKIAETAAKVAAAVEQIAQKLAALAAKVG